MIACGGGVVEREENRILLAGHRHRGGLVIHMTREKEDVIRYLVNEKDRPQWGEEIRSGEVFHPFIAAQLCMSLYLVGTSVPNG